VDVFQRKHYSHRKRLVEASTLTSTEPRSRGADVCQGVTDPRGLLHCDKPVSLSGNVILQAEAKDATGTPFSQTAMSGLGGEEWWFESEDGDRMDLLPEAKRYEPARGEVPGPHAIP